MTIKALSSLLIFLAVIVAACSASETTPQEAAPAASDAALQSTPTPEATTEPTPDAVRAQLPSDTIGIYISATLDKDSSLFRDVNTGPIVLESSTNGVVLLKPDTGEASILRTSRSPSYARNRLVPVTVNDKLYVINEFSSGTVYYDEYNSQSGEVVGVSGRRLPDSTDQYVIGVDKAYYVKRTERIGRPTVIQFIGYDLTSGSKSELGGFDMSGFSITRGLVSAWDCDTSRY